MCQPSKKKNMKCAMKNSALDEPLRSWFLETRSEQKKMETYEANGYFTLLFRTRSRLVNVSGIQRWRERHEIKSLKLHGESASRWKNRAVPRFAPAMKRKIYECTSRRTEPRFASPGVYDC